MDNLKKLNRRELLEILLSVKEENEGLKKENEELKKQLDERVITAEKAGSIAKAALELSGVFEAAQDAADRYVESVRAAVESKLDKNGSRERSETPDE